MRLRPAAWARIEGSGELDVIETVQVIQTLYAAADGTCRLAEEGIELLDSMAPMLIGGMVRDLNMLRQSRDAGTAERRVRDATRGTVAAMPEEAPCGCCSGRRYDRCCGAH